MSQLRKILFYFFVGLYLIICPITILYALGYIVRPGAEKAIIRTGMIYLSTAPAGATVYLGNKRFTHKTPTILRDLIPGEYEVSLHLKDHQVWRKSLSVEAERATVLERVLLLPSEFKQNKIAQGPFEKLIALEETRYFLVWKSDFLADAFLYDAKSERMRPLLSNGLYATAKLLKFVTVPKSRRILLHVKQEGEIFWLWLGIKEKETVIQNVTPYISKEAQNLKWDPEREDALFYLDNGNVTRLDASQEPVRAKTLESVRGFGLFDKMIYALKPDGAFTRVGGGILGEEVLLRDPALANALFGEEKTFDVRLFSKDIIFFIGAKGALLSNRLPYRFTASGMRGLQFDTEHKRVLVWDKKRIGFIDFTKEIEEERVFELGPELFWVFYKGTDIQEVFWVYEASHALFHDGNRLSLLEIETYGKPNLHDLAEVKKDSQIFYAEDLGRFYYLNAGGELSVFELIPKKDLLMFPFPERKEKKKKTKPEEIF